MWLTSSSIGRKLVMAITGVCLVLFVTFHVLMNSVAIIWPEAYNAICEFLGANWYALVASMGLAALFLIHILYAVWLTVQNRAARGADRYAVTSRPPQVEWSSKNMLVLGIVVVAFMGVHLIQFWSKMQLQELVSHDITSLPTVEGAAAAPAFGTLFLQLAFSQWYTPVIYIIGFVALWFHMTHGFWSMLHTIGWSNTTWIPRLHKIGNWWTTIVILLFVAQVGVFTWRASEKYYLTETKLQEQYAEYWGECAEAMIKDFQAEANKAFAGVDQQNMVAVQRVQNDFLNAHGDKFVSKAALIDSCVKVQCPDAVAPQLQSLHQFKAQIEQAMAYAKMMQNRNSNNE